MKRERAPTRKRLRGCNRLGSGSDGTAGERGRVTTISGYLAMHGRASQARSLLGTVGPSRVESVDSGRYGIRSFGGGPC
jgi:hypothetical protein